MLRRWRVDDAELLQRAIEESADHLRPWMAWAADRLTLAQRRELIRRWELDWAAGGDVVLAILRDDRVAGGCGLHRRSGPDTLHIGYWVHASFLRRGVASDAARLLTGAAFEIDGIEHVEIHHDKANMASAAVPRKLGYRFIGEAPDPKDAPAEVGIDCTWRVSRAAWLARA